MLDQCPCVLIFGSALRIFGSAYRGKHRLASEGKGGGPYDPPPSITPSHSAYIWPYGLGVCPYGLGVGAISMPSSGATNSSPSSASLAGLGLVVLVSQSMAFR